MSEGYIRQFSATVDGPWLKENMSIVLSEDLVGFVAVDDKKRLGAVLFNDFSHSSVQTHLLIKSRKALKIGLLDYCKGYVVNVLKKRWIIAYIAEENFSCMNLARNAGFREKTRIHDGWADGVDILMMEGLARELCASLKERRAAYG